VRVTHDRARRREQVELALTALVDRDEPDAIGATLGDDDRDPRIRARRRRRERRRRRATTGK
jgi:hypothetical protein